jgi:uncharacterized protein YoxC
MVRRAVALGIGALVLILLVVGVKGCLDSRTENALKDYNRNVSAVVGDSNSVTKRLFELLNSGSGTATDLQQNVNQVRVTADEDVKRAQAFDVPDDMKDAQYHLLDVLTLRADAIERIADDLPNLDGDQSADAANRIAGQMSVLLASDVIYTQRVVPYIQETFANHGITGQQFLDSVAMPDIQWLDAAFVRKKLTGKGSGKTTGTPAPGTHGHGLISVAIGDTVLQPLPAINRVTAGANPVFTIKFQNQGENDEFDVGVKVAIAGLPPVQKRVDQTTKGTEVSVQMALGRTPTIGTPVRVTVTILPVPGEVNTTNNTATYTVIFNR